MEHDVATRDLLLSRLLRRLSIDAFDVDFASGKMWRFGSLRESLGIPDTIQIDAFLDRVHEADRIRMAQQLHSLTPAAPRYELTYRFQRAGGEYVYLKDEADVLFNQHGQPTRLEGLSQDVTAEACIRQQLSHERQRLSLAMQASSMGAFDWNPETDHLIADDGLHQLLGIEYGQLQWGDQFFSRMHPEDVDRVKHEIKRVLDSDEDYRSEFRMVRPDGTMFWLAGRGCVLTDESSGTRRLVGMNWDITKKKATELELRQARRYAEAANESKSIFLAHMSHELRTPMTAILGYTDLAQSANSNSERDDHLQTIRRNGYYLLEIINDILDISKIEAGKLETSLDVFSPDRLIADVQSIMDVRARENELDLNVRYEGHLPNRIKSDPKRLKQILINLVGNAIKFTQNGLIEIVVRHLEPAPHEDKPGALEIDVIDTGIGMTDQQMQSLFEPFTQGDARINRKYGGTGLGLAISQRLAKMLGGEIIVESKVGAGSKFTCRVQAIPVPGAKMIEPQPESDRESPDLALAEVKLDGRVLVVDDRRDIRFLARGFLTKAGAEVQEASDGIDAIERIQEANQQGQPFDCIILDMQMPRLDGYRTASKLRRSGFKKPILALTAEAMDGDSNRCINAGCDDYLSKPIDVAKLLRMVDRLMTTQRRN